MRETFRAQYRAFTVDEYQDVNLLQQTLLDLWLGDRDDLCVVGDDYQSIYAFTGAGPEHLLGDAEAVPARAGLPARGELPLDTAGARAREQARAAARRRREDAARDARRRAGAGRAAVSRRGVRGRGARRGDPRARVPARGGGDPRAHERAADRLRAGAARRAASRTRARRCSTATRHGASAAGSSARRRRRPRRCAPRRSRRAGSSAGPTSSASASRCARTTSARLVELAGEFDGDAAAFVADLRERFAPGSDAARGVHLLTFHRAKGLEFEAVFLPRLQEKELPSKQARTDGEIAEERRLLYVGLTRAKRVLWLSWSGKRSRFLAELGVAAAAPHAEPSAGVDARCAASARVAARAREGRRGAAVRRLPRLGAARDRRRAARARSASWRRSAASARRSSSATATTC